MKKSAVFAAPEGKHHAGIAGRKDECQPPDRIEMGAGHGAARNGQGDRALRAVPLYAGRSVPRRYGRLRRGVYQFARRGGACFPLHLTCRCQRRPGERRHRPGAPPEREIYEQAAHKYAAVHIKGRFENPFVTIPNAYKTLLEYMRVNGLEMVKKDVIPCFETDGEMRDIYIARK